MYFHPNKNPATCFVSLVLEGNNYHLWNKSIENALNIKNKLEFVDGTILETKKDNKKYVAW